MTDLGRVDIRREDDVVRAHQTTRSIAAQLGFSSFEQTRIATALSEVARNALIYAGGGSVELGVSDDGRTLSIVVVDHGPGIADLDVILRGERPSPTGLGLGLPGARRLVDELAVDTGPQGTRVVIAKRLPRRAGAAQVPVETLRTRVAEHLASDPGQELRRLQRDIAERDVRIAALEQELAETNRGVLALNAELEQRADYQREAIELKTRLISEMGHELRTPLHSIQSIAQFLIDRLDGELTAEQDRQVRIIHEVAVSLAAYINDLLDLSKAESGKAVVHRSRFPVGQLLATVRRLMQPLAASPAVRLRVEPAPALPPLATDEAKLSQILRNLISNALKYTEAGEVVVTARGRDGGETIVFEVTDTGIGIAAEHLEVIFEEFVRVDGPLERRIRGTGLGLPLSRRLAELLGGTIEVESRLGEGSTFRLVVPRVFAGEAAEPAAPTADLAPVAAATPGRPRILVIDDDAASRYVLRRWLDDRYDVDEATGGHDGLRRAADAPPDAIFLDVVMPDLSGFEVLERLAATPRTSRIPVIVYSALALGTNDRARLGRAAAILRKSTASRVADRAAVEEALVKAGIATMLSSEGYG